MLHPFRAEGERIGDEAGMSTDPGRYQAAIRPVCPASWSSTAVTAVWTARPIRAVRSPTRSVRATAVRSIRPATAWSIWPATAWTVRSTATRSTRPTAERQPRRRPAFAAVWEPTPAIPCTAGCSSASRWWRPSIEPAVSAVCASAMCAGCEYFLTSKGPRLRSPAG